MRRGLIIVHTGDGKGKTTAALGLAIRAFGAGLKVLILQFIKGGRRSGELESLKILGIEVRQLGLGFITEENFSEQKKSARAAIDSGADVIYIGGEVFKPLKPFTIDEIKKAVEVAHSAGKKIILATPKTSKDKDLAELAEIFSEAINFDGVLVGNLGALNLIKTLTDAPIFADVSFSVFNPVAAEFLQSLGAVQATASLELSFAQVRSVVENSPLPIEIIIHGALESMISDHDFAKLYLPDCDAFATPEKLNRHYALEDEAGEVHKLRVDQFKRWHIFFGKDLCLLPYVEKFLGAAALRIEAQNYSPEVTAQVVKLYRAALDGKNFSLGALKKITPNLGAGVYRFKQSKNSIQLSS